MGRREAWWLVSCHKREDCEEQRSRILHATGRARPAFERQLCFYDLTKLTKLISKTKNNIRGVPILVRGGLAVYGKENVLEEIIDKNSFRKILTNYVSR